VARRADPAAPSFLCARQFHVSPFRFRTIALRVPAARRCLRVCALPTGPAAAASRFTPFLPRSVPSLLTTPHLRPHAFSHEHRLRNSLLRLHRHEARRAARGLHDDRRDGGGSLRLGQQQQRPVRRRVSERIVPDPVRRLIRAAKLS
jgi:hypothetical protein